MASSNGRVISENPQIVSNGFIKAGITGALDEDLTNLDSDIDVDTFTDEEKLSVMKQR